MLRSRSAFLLWASMLSIALPALADNLVLGGQFDQPAAIDDWTVEAGAGEAWLYFEPVPDAGACTGSGSALLITSWPGPRVVQYSVCAGGVTGGDEYAVGLDVNFPHGETEGWLYWGVTWFEGAGCTGTAVATVWIGPAGYVPGWQTLEFWNSTELRVASARVELSVITFPGSDPLHLNVDRVFVRPAGDLFADGFELGETCRWSSAAGVPAG